MQIIKLGQHILGDHLTLKQIPTDESFRFPERAVNTSDKKRVLLLRLCKRKFLLNLYIQDCEGKLQDLNLELFSSCSVLALK